jgi:hypothetical protein
MRKTSTWKLFGHSNKIKPAVQNVGAFYLKRMIANKISLKPIIEIEKWG